MNKSSVTLSRKKNIKEMLTSVSTPIIIAENIRTPENMGLILRIAANIGALKTYFISEKANDFKKYKIKRTSSGASEKIDWGIVNSFDEINSIPDNYTFIAIETCDNATSLFNTELPKKAVFVVGNEVLGISDNLLTKCSSAVYIPVPGPISSLNVTHALAVVGFEWLRQNSAS